MMVGGRPLCSCIAMCIACTVFGSEKPFVLRITVERNVWSTEDSVLINAEIQNVYSAPAWIVLPNDGSSQKVRYPQAYFMIWDDNRKPVEDNRKPCKVVDPPLPASVCPLEVGQRKALFPNGFLLNPFIRKKPGKYRVICVYSTEAGREAEWFGLYTDEYWNHRNENFFWRKRDKDVRLFLKRLKRVPRVTLVSEPIQLEVRPALAVSQAKALELAETVCRKEGWEWVDIHIDEDDGAWRIVTHFHRLGGNAFVRIDKKTGAVSEKHLTGP